jgi:hypothetical protein
MVSSGSRQIQKPPSGGGLFLESGWIKKAASSSPAAFVICFITRKSYERSS